MLQYRAETIVSTAGAPIAAVEVDVYQADGVTLATVYADAVGTSPVPSSRLTTDAAGAYAYYAPVGVYVERISEPGYQTRDVVVNLVEGGGTSWRYTNAEPMPATVGGYGAGTTFDEVPLTEMFDGLLYPYQAPAFTAFAISGQSTTLEVGDELAANRTFTWATSEAGNIAANTVVLRDVTSNEVIASGLANDGAEATSYPAAPFNYLAPATHTFRVEASNTQGGTFSRTFAVAWRYRLYRGTSTDPGPYSGAAVAALADSALATGFAGTYAFAAGGYKMIAWPVAFGLANAFKDAETGFNVPMQAPQTVAVTNAYGVVANYYVYRTTNVIGAALLIVVS